ncbi:MAG: hypothetical protein ABIG20_03650 [archaeon]
MVLESLFTSNEIRRHPWDMFILGLFVSSLGTWLAYYIFPNGSSSWSIFLTTLALAPLIHRVLVREEQEEFDIKEKSLFKRHADVISDYVFLFFGMLTSFTAWFLFVPDAVRAILFNNQLALLTTTVDPSLALLTNLKILSAFILIAFVFGAGAILLLAWDASITAALIGSIIRKSYAGVSIGGVLLYEIPEIMGYSLGAIAGGMLSAAIIRKHYKTKAFPHILLDVMIMIFFAVVLVVISALAKAYILGA